MGLRMEKKGAMEGRKGPRTEGKGWKGPRWEAQESKKVPNEVKDGKGWGGREGRKGPHGKEGGIGKGRGQGKWEEPRSKGREQGGNKETREERE